MLVAVLLLYVEGDGVVVAVNVSVHAPYFTQTQLEPTAAYKIMLTEGYKFCTNLSNSNTYIIHVHYYCTYS